MALNIRDLCRLCAKNDPFSKELFVENNKNVLRLIQEFVQITVSEHDDLPTKICLNCEEKIVTFNLFILECHKIQGSLRQMCMESNENIRIKVENDIAELGVSLIKAEVKDELTAEEIESAINNEALTDQDYPDDDDSHNTANSDDLDDISIATLKQIKKKTLKKRDVTENGEFKAVLKRPNLRVEDFVKFQCNICEEKMKTWCTLSFHYYRIHKSRPFLYCICGFLINSKSVLYKHVSKHKLESRTLRKSTEPDDIEDTKNSHIKVKDFVNFTCNSCQKKCSSWYSLKSHCEEVHDLPPVVQCACGVTLKSKSVVYKHIQDHRHPNVFCCDKCPRIVKTEAALIKHKLRHVPKSEREYFCSTCNKMFKSRDNMKSHEKSHIPIEDRKVYHCDMCDMKFTTRSSATAHKRVVHEKIKSYICDLCGYACGTHGELRQHRAIHSDDKPFVCRKCSKPFKTYSNLKTHMDTHEETSYACYVCNRVLNSRRTLRKHLLVHEDKCRHVCSYCNKAFKRRQTLKVHMYTHTGDKPLTCKWCDERFSYASTLRSHRLRYHPDKMATQALEGYNTYAHVTNNIGDNMQEDYIKNDVNAVNGVAKNEAM